MTPTAPIPPAVRTRTPTWPDRDDLPLATRRAASPAAITAAVVDRRDVGGRVQGGLGQVGHAAPASAPNGSVSWPVTWRKSSSRSVAARAKLTIGQPGRDRCREESGRGGVVAAEAEFDRAVVEDRRGRDVGVGLEGGACRLERVALGQDADAQDRAIPEPTLDVADRALRQDPAAIDDRHARAQLLELGQDVAADEDRLAERPELAQEFAQLDASARVQAGGRLVEEQDLRVVDQGVRQAQPLLHAARERLDVVVAAIGEVDELQEVADRPASLRGRQAVAASEEVQVLPDLHVVVDPEHVRHEPEDAPDLVGVPRHGPAGDLGDARRRLQERGQDPERRGLAGAVRPDETEDLALLDVEVHAGDGHRRRVALDESLGPDDGAHSTVPRIERLALKPTCSLTSLTKRTMTVPLAGSTKRAGSATL